MQDLHQMLRDKPDLSNMAQFSTVNPLQLQLLALARQLLGCGLGFFGS
jgi:hypothetical protein